MKVLELFAGSCSFSNVAATYGFETYTTDIKQFGDIPSVRRCCRLMNEDVKTGGIKYVPLISPQVKKDLEQKNNVKKVKNYKLTIRYATPEQPIILYFD